MTDALWIEASQPVEDEDRTLRMLRAKTRAAAVWPWLARAASVGEFDHRLALAASHLAESINDTEMYQQVQASLREDFQQIAAARDLSAPVLPEYPPAPRRRAGGRTAARAPQRWEYFDAGTRRWMPFTARGPAQPVSGKPDDKSPDSPSDAGRKDGANPYYFDGGQEGGPASGDSGRFAPEPTSGWHNPINDEYPLAPSPWQVPPGGGWVEPEMNWTPPNPQTGRHAYHHWAAETDPYRYRDEGVETGLGRNPDYFAHGPEGAAGQPESMYGLPVNPIDEPDERVDMYGGVPPLNSPGSQNGATQGYSQQDRDSASQRSSAWRRRGTEGYDPHPGWAKPDEPGWAHGLSDHDIDHHLRTLPPDHPVTEELAAEQDRRRAGPELRAAVRHTAPGYHGGGSNAFYDPHDRRVRMVGAGPQDLANSTPTTSGGPGGAAGGGGGGGAPAGGGGGAQQMSAPPPPPPPSMTPGGPGAAAGGAGGGGGAGEGIAGGSPPGGMSGADTGGGQAGAPPAGGAGGAAGMPGGGMAGGGGGAPGGAPGGGGGPSNVNSPNPPTANDPSGSDQAGKQASGQWRRMGRLWVWADAGGLSRDQPTESRPTGLPDEYLDRTFEGPMHARPRQGPEERTVNTPQQAQQPVPTSSSSDLQQSSQQGQQQEEQRQAARAARAAVRAITRG